MATFNGEGYLRAQLQSLLQQTLLPTSLVISDDNSSDSTVDILEEFAASAPFPVHILSNPGPRGIQSNFRNALAHTKGDVVAWCDQDDIWGPTKLEEMMGALANPTVQCVAHSYQTVDSEGNPLGGGRWFHGDRRLTGLDYANIVSFHGCCMAFRADPIRSLLLENWPTFSSEEESETPMLHDFATLFIARHLGTVQYLDERLIRYRRHGGNATAHTATDVEDARLMRSRTNDSTYSTKALEAKQKSDWWKKALVDRPELSAPCAVADYQRRADSLERRAKLYSMSSGKATRLVQNILSGCYGFSRRGRLPMRSLLGDTMFALKRS